MLDNILQYDIILANAPLQFNLNQRKGATMARKKLEDLEEPSQFMWRLVRFIHYFEYAVPMLLAIGGYALMPAMKAPVSFDGFSLAGSAELYYELLIMSWVGFFWIAADVVVLVYRHTPSDMIYQNLVLSIITALIFCSTSMYLYGQNAMGWWIAVPTALTICDVLLVAFAGTNVALLKRLLQEDH